MTDPREIDERLERLGKATEGVRPRAGFTAKVMSAALAQAPAARAPDWWSDVPRVARRLLPLAAIAAAVGVVWAVRATSDVDAALADTYDTVELEW
ncbi:MAG TPA: hypothetical protein VLM85_03615 [Polyangiaceae bacterium]|nr:hypothetical protein [Polyangiaceae bacterium]